MKDLFKIRTLIIAAALSPVAAGQTQVDLRSQAKSVDFTGASGTKPFQAGPALPSECGVGQMFFLTTAPVGQNAYGCSAGNAWSPQTSPSSGITVATSGVAVGTRGTVDISSGDGLILVAGDTGSAISVQPTIDTGYVQTLQGHQRGTAVLCASSGGNALHYACQLSPTLSAYTRGMLVNWVPDVAGTGGPTTLDVDTLGSRRIVLADGAENPAASHIAAGQMYQLWYDGSAFRLVSHGGNPAPTPFANLQTTAGPVTQNGTDVVLYAAQAVPPLAAGACYRVFFGEQSTEAGVTIKVVVDSTVIADIAVDPTTYRAQGTLLYCNITGTQSAQAVAFITPLFTGKSPFVQYTTQDSAVSTAPPVNWSVPHNIYLKTNVVTGSVIGHGFGIY